jgi:hypothetical protein
MPLVGTIALATFASAGSTSVLWENVKVGMSQEDVQKAQPQAIEGEGYWCALTIPKKPVAGYTMKVCFGFPKNGGLGNVVLTQKGLGAYPDIVKALTAKYGSPRASEKCSGGLVKKCQVGWIKGAVSIEVTQMDVADTFVTYKAIDNEGL